MAVNIDVRPASAVVDPVDAIGALTDMIRTECAVSDATRAIPAKVIDGLRDAGVFHLLAPIDLGGRELDPVTFLETVEAASYADGSVGWCVMIGGCYATFAGMLPSEAAREIYGNPMTISAGAFRPDGVAIEVDGGYRISGRWPLASGSSHANWYVGGCVIVRDGEPVTGPTGAPLVREFFFPAGVTEIIETWDSTGLRGTASHDYAVADVFVPATHTVWFQEPPAVDRPLYHMPPVAMFATFIAAVPLGIAVTPSTSSSSWPTPRLRPSHRLSSLTSRSPTTVSDAPTSLVTSSRASLVATLGRLWGQVRSGHQPALAEQGALWLAATHAAHCANEAIQLLYTAAGATSVYSASPLDRCLRDARTAVQHVCTQELHYELTGRWLLGREIIPSIWMLDYRGELDHAPSFMRTATPPAGRHVA